MLDNLDLLTSIQRLTLAEVDKRLADLDAERAALSFMRRSLVARDKAARRAARRLPPTEGVPHA
jgi:hypothetical protein